MNGFRIGYGCDFHRFAAGRPLMLCGVQIPFSMGLLGHSDADAPLHALTDALLGALALGDIGKLFPDTDAKWKDADSLELLKKAWNHPAFQPWQLGNADVVIIAQKPKIAPFTAQMRERIASALGTGTDRISVKGKTTEEMGFCGTLEGLEARAVVLLEKRND